MSRRCRSKPFKPGSRLSRMAHAVPSRLPRSRKSSAEPKVSTLKSADPTTSIGFMLTKVVFAGPCVYRTLV